MGCKASKSGPEPCASNILGCNKLSRSYSSPIQFKDEPNSLQNPRCESFHIVSLTSSTYGSLPSPNSEEEQSRAVTGTLEHRNFARFKNERDLHGVTVPYSWPHGIDDDANIEGAKLQNGANYKQEQTVNMWELMESLEDKKAALHVIRDLMEKSRVSGPESEKSSPRMSATIHTVEELDSILDVRQSLPTDHHLRRGSLMEPVIRVRDSHKFKLDSNKMHGTSFSTQLNQLSLAMQNSQEARGFDSVRRKDLYRSQELVPRERSDLFGRQDLDSMKRNNLTRSQEFDSLRRSNLSRDQGFGFTRRSNLSQSQEFVGSFLAKPKEAIAPRQSLSGLPSAVRIGDYEGRFVTSHPDPVLRSPMLTGSNRHERLRVRPGLLSPLSSVTPKLSGLNQTSFAFDEAPVNIPVCPKPSAAKAVTPAGFNASRRGAELSSLRNRNSKDSNGHVAMQPAMSKYLVPRPIDDSQGVGMKAKYGVSKIPPRGFVATFDNKTNLIAPQKSTQDVANISTAKQSGWSSSASKGSISPTASSSTAGSSAPQGRESEMDDSVSSDYEFVPSTEVVEEDRRPSGSLSTKKPSQSATALPSDTRSDKSTIWSLDMDRPNGLGLDPELLASFEEALELFCADDWCTTRLGESAAAVTSGSNSKLDRYEILEDHAEKPLSQPGALKKVVSSKIVPLEIQEQNSKADSLERFEMKCPPGGDERCVLYITSLRGIRKTFEDCSRTRAILQSSDVLIDERDIAMHAEFRQEMISLAGKSASVPRLFIKGRHIGGGDEVSQLHETGALSTLLQSLPRQVSQTVCDGCGGLRFIPCSTCSGSCKVITQEGGVTRCEVCNENGLSRCPVCL